MPEIRGVDVSKHQPVASVPWQSLRAAGRAEFAFIRSAYGLGPDLSFDHHVEKAQGAGVPIVGAYHFARPARPVADQADLLIRSCSYDLVPVLDLEILDDQPIQAVADFAIEFVERVEKALGRRCVFYTYPSFASRLRLSADLAVRPLWIAHYGTKKPQVPSPWQDWLIWQYDGDRGERAPNGLDLDFNVCRLTVEQLREELFRPLETHNC